MRGAPTKFRKQIIDEAEALAGLGFTKQDFCHYWGISRDTLNRWERKNIDLSDAIKRGIASANVSVTKALYNAAKQGNIVAMIFWLKNRAGWKDQEPLVDQSQHITFKISKMESNGSGEGDSDKAHAPAVSGVRVTH